MLDSTRNYLRDQLYLHNENKKTIKAFRESILHPYRETDTNIGGGSPNIPSDPTGSMAIKLSTPKELKRTIEVVEVIDKVLEHCTADHYDVIKSKYIDGFKGKKNDLVSSETHLSESTVKRKDREFLEKLRLDLGYP